MLTMWKLQKQQKKMKGMFNGKQTSSFAKHGRYLVDLGRKMKSMAEHKIGWWNLLLYQIKENKLLCTWKLQETIA